MQLCLSEVLYSLAMAAALIVEGIVMFWYLYKKAQNTCAYTDAFLGMMVAVQIGTLAMTVPALWWFSVTWLLAIGLWAWVSILASGIVVHIMIRDYDSNHQEEKDHSDPAETAVSYHEILKACERNKPSERTTSSTVGGVGKPVTIEYGGVGPNGKMALRVNFWGISKGYTYLCAPGAMDAIFTYHNYIIQNNKGNQKSEMISSFLNIIRTAKFIDMRRFNDRDVLAESYQLPSQDEGYTDYVLKYWYYSDIEKCWLNGFIGLAIHEAVGDTVEQTLGSLPFIHNVTELFESARKP